MKNVIENNKLIAEFMQWDNCTHQNKITNPKHPQFNKTQPIEHGFSLPRTHPIVENMYTDCPGYDWDYSKDEEQLIFYYDDLKFHSSWDWLMPVVIKCFEVDNNANDDLNFKLNDALLETNIETLYNACISFIKWYNQNKAI